VDCAPNRGAIGPLGLCRQSGQTAKKSLDLFTFALDFARPVSLIAKRRRLLPAVSTSTTSSISLSMTSNG
jgi:hypothetical protein